MKKDILVPNIGEFKNVEVIEVIAKNGENLEKNNPLITIESDKSSVEIPSPYSGNVVKIYIKVGDKVSEGDRILSVEVSENEKSENEIEKIDFNKSESLNQKIEPKNEIKKEINEFKRPDSKNVLASPKARKFARELGVNVKEIPGTQRLGRVIEEDIKNYVSTRINSNLENKEKKKDKKIKSEYTHSDFGEIEVKDIPRIKRIAAPHLANSWNSIPHVTNHDEADVTEMEEFRSSLIDIYTGEKKKITPLAFIIKALVSSLKKFPSFNSSIDDIDEGKITLKKYFHIGIAVDTQNGLMVPKLRNANNKNIDKISKELKQLSDDCRNLKIDKKEFFGGSMTITSLGGIGGSFFTPIINYPEVAILGIGRSYKKQLFINGKFITRTVLPLSLSYDHRIIDGAEAAKFNNDLKDNLGSNFAYKLAI
jgi:pyruvate dehydrogenase E2 component (dihydrolipoamide acetyltransferase)